MITITQYKYTDEIEKATHWKPINDIHNINYKSITIGKMYEFVYLESEDEWIIVDDAGVKSLIYLCHDGELYEEVKE